MWSNPQNTVDLTTFTEEILNGKLLFLSSVDWEAYTEACQQSKVGRFAKLVNC